MVSGEGCMERVSREWDEVEKRKRCDSPNNLHRHKHNESWMFVSQSFVFQSKWRKEG